MTPQRRALIAWSASAFILFVVGFAILAGAVDPAPSYPSLSDRPDDSIPGTVVYNAFDDEECLRSVAASGAEPIELQCGGDDSYRLGWTSDGNILVIRKVDGRRSFVMLAPDTGRVKNVVALSDIGLTERREARAGLEPGSRVERADGAKVRVRYGDGFRYEDGDGDEGPPSVIVHHADSEKQTILRADGAGDRYEYVDAQWSPDGEWVLVSDSVGRLLVVGADGSPGARVLVDEGHGYLNAAWYIPGDKTYTVNLPNKQKTRG